MTNEEIQEQRLQNFIEAEKKALEARNLLACLFSAIRRTTLRMAGSPQMPSDSIVYSPNPTPYDAPRT